MKRLKILCLLSLAFTLSWSSYSQQQALTNIQKNINEQAAGLEQLLNFTLDTLTLRSDKNILRVTFLSHDEKDSVIIDVDAPEIKIPLYHFKKGRYTIAVYREDKIIALGVKRVEDIPRPEDAIADLEESILRSSLSDKELLNRNIKPLKKTPRVDDTRLAEAKPKVDRTKNTRTAPERPSRERNKREVTNVNKKSAFELAAEREAAQKAARQLRQEKENDVASVKPEKPKRPEKPTTLIEVKKVTYNLSIINNDESIEKQSREDYRANNLRPNGTPYQN
ncbi:hypothetical protein [Lacinutrix chionoecetis]